MFSPILYHPNFDIRNPTYARIVPRGLHDGHGSFVFVERQKNDAVASSLFLYSDNTDSPASNRVSCGTTDWWAQRNSIWLGISNDFGFGNHPLEIWNDGCPMFGGVNCFTHTTMPHPRGCSA